MQIAVVDIETTGGTPSNSRITELCAIVTDGKNILHRFETLLNPGCMIPPGITSLTGITDEMVADAPVFADIAQELHHLLHDKIFVAHNVNFDYSFIHREFEKLGIPYSVSKVCSAKLARKAFPGQRSYSLGSICSVREIAIQNRHRAGGDADATVELVHQIIAEKGESFFLEMAGRSNSQFVLPPGIQNSDIESLPAAAGVYTFLSTAGKPLYIGKAINLQKRVLQHFDKKRGKSALQLEKIAKVDFEETGSELMALIVEAEGIHKYWPEWNKAGKYPANRYAIVHYATGNGEFRLQTLRRSRNSKEGIGFTRLTDARNALGKIISENGICASRAYSSSGCNDSSCYCAEIPEERSKIHNARVQQAMDSLISNTSDFFLICRGRNPEENGVLHVVNGDVVGRGYADITKHDTSPENLVSKMKPLAETRAIVNSFVRRIESGILLGYKIIPGQAIPNAAVEAEAELEALSEPQTKSIKNTKSRRRIP